VLGVWSSPPCGLRARALLRAQVCQVARVGAWKSQGLYSMLHHQHKMCFVFITHWVLLAALMLYLRRVWLCWTNWVIHTTAQHWVNHGVNAPGAAFGFGGKGRRERGLLAPTRTDERGLSPPPLLQ
jgi:hypothetical protein